MKTKLILGLLVVYGAAAQTPAVTGVVNAFSFVPSLSPGVLASVNGTNFGTDKTALTVTVGGKQTAVLIAATNTQVNVQIPVDLQPGATTLVVTRSGAASAPFNITLAAYAPALDTNLTAGGDSKSALLLDGNSFKPVTQVKPGDSVVAFAVGLGATNPAAVTGVAAASNEVCVTSPQLTLGGVAFAPLFCGIVAGQIGLYQLNLKIPTVAGGTQPLVLTIGGVSSPPLNVNVAASGPTVPTVPPSGSFGFLVNFSFGVYNWPMF